MHLSISIALLAVLGPFTLANPIDHAGSEIAAGHEISGRVDDPISSLQGAQAELTSTIEVLKSSNADPQMQTALNILEQSTQRFTSQLVITSSLIDSVATLINSILFPTTIVRNSVSELLHVMDITVVDLQSIDPPNTPKGNVLQDASNTLALNINSATSSITLNLNSGAGLAQSWGVHVQTFSVSIADISMRLRPRE